MGERDPRMEPFDALVGTWDTEATHPLLDGGVVTGHVTYEWLEGGHFLLQRSHNDHELFPDGLGVIGVPEEGDGLRLEYFDSRGVRRTYETSFEDGVWRVWRDHPGFDQRMAVEPRKEGFEGTYQLAEKPGEWRDDLHLVHRPRR